MTECKTKIRQYRMPVHKIHFYLQWWLITNLKIICDWDGMQQGKRDYGNNSFYMNYYIASCVGIHLLILKYFQ